ncbi:hypothetical protein, partial [Bifidobacterium scardovii]
MSEQIVDLMESVMPGPQGVPGPQGPMASETAAQDEAVAGFVSGEETATSLAVFGHVDRVYDTVSAMRADRLLRAGMGARTRGYWTPGDGGPACTWCRTIPCTTRRISVTCGLFRDDTRLCWTRTTSA